MCGDARKAGHPHIRMKQFIKKLQHLALAASLVSSMAMGIASTASAATTSLSAAPRVTFTFDDGMASALANAAPALQTYGFSGTNYIITGCVGMTTVPNNCKADPNHPYMTWEQIKTLHDTYGWNIGSHTVTHPYLASTGGGEQEMLTTEQIRAELADSKSALEAQGYDAVDFAAPYGDYNNVVLAEAAKLYGTFRGFADIGFNAWPYNDRLVVNQQVQDTAGETTAQTVARVKTYVDQAVTNNQWLVLTFHEITAGASSGNPDDYQFSRSGLEQIAAYVKQKNVSVVSPHDALVNNNTNMLSNGSFDSAISTDYQNRETTAASQWTTDDTTGTLVKNDNEGNGSYVLSDTASPKNALFISANGADAHIWAPKVAVDANLTYAIKGYFNIQTITAGEVAFYIDEYDANGTIISNQYSSAVRYDANVNAIRVRNANFAYKPTSASVVAARMYINVQGNSGITGYVDNVEMFSPVATTPTSKPGDINSDGLVNLNDLSILSNNWNKTGVTAAQGDLNGDGAVNLNDLSILSSNWGK